MRRRFATLDVFAAQRFAGNPLAVVTEAGGLDSAEMQSIAREFGLSETVFVLPPRNPTHRARLRIFTPAAEVPFAGHPTIGSAVLLAEADGHPPDREISFVLEEEIGPVPCAVRLGRDGGGEASFRAPMLPIRQGVAESHEAIAAALGLQVYDIGFQAHVPTIYSAGLGFTFVPVRDLAAIARARVDPGRWAEAIPRHHGVDAAYLYTRETVCESASFHARMFAPGLGVGEDPATGSAAAAFAGVLAEFEPRIDGTHDYVIEQGFEMGRPSQIRLEMELRSRALAIVKVGGAALRVTEGVMEA